MNERLEYIKEKTRSGDHWRHRQAAAPDILPECEQENLSWMRRAAKLVTAQCEAEIPIIEPDEQIAFTRTLPANTPLLYSMDEWERLTSGRTIHELGPINNICPDWRMVLSQGLSGRRQVALDAISRKGDDLEAVEFLESAIEAVDAVIGLAERYAAEAQHSGRNDLAAIFKRVPAQPAGTFQEALQSLRFLHGITYLIGHYQISLGRFDQYMWPYLKNDLDSSRLDMERAYDLLAEFFISLNRDSNLYPGVQQGDNGQTITLGGVDREGFPAVNDLTILCLKVTRDVSMIDPKINLRISSGSELDLLSLATELTAKGLGFPQYSNDDVVIPALAAHGYRLEDARDYAIAACWEFIIPGRGMDVVNIGAVSFPSAVDSALRSGLSAGEDMERILQKVCSDISNQVNRLAGDYEKLLLPPAPFLSVLMDGCLEAGRDLSKGALYNHFGIHGAGSANAADALASVQQFVFQENTLQPADLLAALDANFQGWEGLRSVLVDAGPKVGNDDDRVDDFLVQLFEMLADACEVYGETSRGGRLRAGSGSAMYYIWLAQGYPGMREPMVGATAEGRRKGEPLAANLAPTQGVRIRGPFSVLQSFAKLDTQRICNGGPITLEISDTVFRDEDSIRKVAMLVRTFAQLGCQQLQINSMNLDTLLDAHEHPEMHKNLIVRVWGWSGYFCELSPEYQEQIIARHIYQIN